MTGIRNTLVSMALLAASLSACRTTPQADGAPSLHGAVGAREVTYSAAPAPRLALADNEAYHPPIDAPGNALPAYPPELLERRLPAQIVCLRVSIGGDGAVIGSAPLREGAVCAASAAIDDAFYRAAGHAVAGWRFDPAFRCVFRDAAEMRALGPGCMEERSVPQPVSLAYRFEFVQHEGRGSVRLGR